MGKFIESLFGLEGKVAFLTGAGGFLVGEISRAAGLAGMKVVCCDVRLEDAQRTAEEIGRVCLFLASQEASAITGQCINVDCGVLPQ